MVQYIETIDDDGMMSVLAVLEEGDSLSDRFFIFLVTSGVLDVIVLGPFYVLYYADDVWDEAFLFVQTAAFLSIIGTSWAVLDYTQGGRDYGQLSLIPKYFQTFSGKDLRRYTTYYSDDRKVLFYSDEILFSEFFRKKQLTVRSSAFDSIKWFKVPVIFEEYFKATEYFNWYQSFLLKTLKNQNAKVYYFTSSTKNSESLFLSDLNYLNYGGYKFFRKPLIFIANKIAPRVEHNISWYEHPYLINRIQKKRRKSFLSVQRSLHRRYKGRHNRFRRRLLSHYHLPFFKQKSKSSRSRLRNKSKINMWNRGVAFGYYGIFSDNFKFKFPEIEIVNAYLRLEKLARNRPTRRIKRYWGRKHRRKRRRKTYKRRRLYYDDPLRETTWRTREMRFFSLNSGWSYFSNKWFELKMQVLFWIRKFIVDYKRKRSWFRQFFKIKKQLINLIRFGSVTILNHIKNLYSDIFFVVGLFCLVIFKIVKIFFFFFFLTWLIYCFSAFFFLLIRIFDLTALNCSWNYIDVIKCLVNSVLLRSSVGMLNQKKLNVYLVNKHYLMNKKRRFFIWWLMFFFFIFYFCISSLLYYFCFVYFF